MSVEITVPDMGESVSSGIIAAWIKQDGEEVSEGEDLFELETDKATLAVPAEASGVLHVQAAEGDEVEVGQVVAVVDDDAGADAGAATERTDSEAKAEPRAVDEPSEDADSSGEAPARFAPARIPDDLPITPSARRIVEQYGIDPATLNPTGASGNVTKEDALAALLSKAEGLLEAAGREHARTGAAGGGAEPAVAGTAAGGAAARGGRAEGAADERADTGSEEHPPAQVRQPMSTIRKRIAENLVESQRSSAHLTTFNEIDMHEVVAVRKRYRDAFEKKHGVRLGFMSFFVKAVCEALVAYPHANAAVDGEDLIINNRRHIGVAVSTDRGLLVPVIRDADRKSFSQIEEEIVSFATRAREKRIGVDELTGGTFSITNGGVFGSLLSTPIPTPGQTAILGMHSIQNRPVAVGESIEIQPMMYVAVTYDHRVMDGREAVSFLVKIKQLVEDPSRMLLGL